MWTLLDGRALTATELAIAAGTSAQNISMHLAKLAQADLLRVESQGRHKYYKFSGKDVAYAIEAMANLISPAAAKGSTGIENNSPVKYCRSCYDHLAGKVGVSITDSLLHQQVIVNNNNTFEVSKKGEKWFYDLGINIDDLKGKRRCFYGHASTGVKDETILRARLLHHFSTKCYLQTGYVESKIHGRF